MLSAPNGARLDRALGSLEHVVAIDPYLNETTRHAHVVLPPALPLARGHYDLALNVFAVRNVAKYVEPAVPRTPEQRYDWEILGALAARVLAPRPLRRTASRAVRSLTPERILDPLLRLGPHKLSLARLREAPHGLDLGPLQPGRIAGRIATRDGKIDAAPAELVREAREHLTAEADGGTNGHLALIGRRELRSNNSWLHNSARLLRGDHRCTLLVHPEDAAARQLATGDMAELSSEAGAVTVPVEVTDSVRAGVVSLPHGWGHGRDGVRLRVARNHCRRERQRRHQRALPGHAERQRRLQRRPGDRAAQ